MISLAGSAVLAPHSARSPQDGRWPMSDVQPTLDFWECRSTPPLGSAPGTRRPAIDRIHMQHAISVMIP